MKTTNSVKPNEPEQISLEGLTAVHADMVYFDTVEESVVLAKGVTYIPESVKSATEKKALAQAHSRPEKFSVYEPYYP